MVIYSTRTGTIVRRGLATNGDKMMWCAEPGLNLDQVAEVAVSPDGKLAEALASTRHYQVLALENFLPAAQD